MDSPADGAAEASGSAVTLIGHRRSMVSRPDARTDAVSLPVGVRTVVSMVGITAQGSVRFVYSVLIGRFLPEGFLAATNSAISTALLATILWPTSVSAAAAKFVAREAGDVERRAALTGYLARLTLWTSSGLGLLVSLLTYVLLRPGDALTSVLVGLLAIGWSGYTFVRGTQYATGRILRATAWDILAFLIAVGGLIVVLALGLDAWLLLPLTGGYLVYAAVGWPRYNRGELAPHRRREINSFVTWDAIGLLATGGFLQLTMVLAYQTSDLRSADAYAAALTLATPASMLGSVLSLLLLPALSGAVGRQDLAAVRRQTDFAHRGLVTGVGAVFGVLVVGSGLLVSVVWPTLPEALPVLQILLIATFLLTATTAVSESIRSASEYGARVIALTRCTGFLVGVGIGVALIPSMSVVGIALGYLAGMLIALCVPVVLVWRRDRHRWRSLTVRAGAGALVAGALLGARQIVTAGDWLDLVLVAVFLATWSLLHRRDLTAVGRRLAAASSNGAGRNSAER